MLIYYYFQDLFFDIYFFSGKQWGQAQLNFNCA